MNTTNYASILDEAPTEVNYPKVLPAGTYHCVNQGQPRYDKSSQKGTPFVEFTLKPIQALEDVDQEALEEVGGLDGKTLRTVFYLTEDAAYRLDEFHEHCGLDLSIDLSRRLRNDEVTNTEVLAVVKHRNSQDGTRVFAEVARTAKVK